MKLDLAVGGYIFYENKVLLIYHKYLQLWLPVGGHIDENETPDDALIREAKEETNLDIIILNQSDLPIINNTKSNNALPFYTNVHFVKDHNHYGLFYICRTANINNLKLSKESLDFKWFTKEEILNSKEISQEIKNQTIKAFEVYNQVK